jgi:CRISPR/Cas system-associated endonuclease Cas1
MAGLSLPGWAGFATILPIVADGTPGNALLNYLYAVLETEMTVALLAVGLDPGIGIFHSDIDRRASLALDAIEAVRPYVDHWVLDYLSFSVFANRDFIELPDGEVRLTHPLNAHLAHTAALWEVLRAGCGLAGA